MLPKLVQIGPKLTVEWDHQEFQIIWPLILDQFGLILVAESRVENN